MKNTLALIFSLISLIGFSQKEVLRGDSVSFETSINSHHLTKDGLYSKGYVIDISNQKAKELHGKKVRIQGVITIVPGIEDQNNSLDENGNVIIRQGRASDTKFIKNPVITILK